ncbi:hypothetical protein BJY14_002677 [Actinomadura luteofluorescens]|uniref:Uncharacterized protein n=1 Tax=Actinomadura luteofluorescens TaxID=46163 RepID=A0A7Y9EFF0_9ACTN|nr:hypothetical protein [Actinomadura luteofluorescens]NYD46694.1 hypothetical protein [Actinomadura luteofluorescens]
MAEIAVRRRDVVAPGAGHGGGRARAGDPLDRTGPGADRVADVHVHAAGAVPAGAVPAGDLLRLSAGVAVDVVVRAVAGEVGLRLGEAREDGPGDLGVVLRAPRGLLRRLLEDPLPVAGEVLGDLGVRGLLGLGLRDVVVDVDAQDHPGDEDDAEERDEDRKAGGQQHFELAVLLILLGLLPGGPLVLALLAGARCRRVRGAALPAPETVHERLRDLLAELGLLELVQRPTAGAGVLDAVVHLGRVPVGQGAGADVGGLPEEVEALLPEVVALRHRRDVVGREALLRGRLAQLALGEVAGRPLEPLPGVALGRLLRRRAGGRSLEVLGQLRGLRGDVQRPLHAERVVLVELDGPAPQRRVAVRVRSLPVRAAVDRRLLLEDVGDVLRLLGRRGEPGVRTERGDLFRRELGQILRRLAVHHRLQRRRLWWSRGRAVLQFIAVERPR